jgi:polyisoprenoid-binding protein YceI
MTRHKHLGYTKFKLILLIVSITFASTVSAENLILSKSSVQYSIKHLIVTTEKGSFTTFDGSVNLDENGMFTSMNARISVDSVDSGLKVRDDYIKNKGMFDAENFPYMSFEMSEFSGTTKKGKVKGKLTLKGITRPVDLDLTQVNSESTDKEQIRVYKLNGSINRKEFNIGVNVPDSVLSDEVELLITMAISN